MYRLADFIRYNMQKGLNYKGSIAEEYLKRNKQFERPTGTKVDVNFELLKHIVDERKQPPELNTVSIHVRLGDILSETSGPFVDQNNLPSFSDIVLKHNLHKKYKNCSLYYGNHKVGEPDANVDKSEIILNNIATRLTEMGLTTKIISNSADEDFVALSTCLCYISGIKGFGWLSASINPNTVYWDNHNIPNFSWMKHPTQQTKKSLMKGYNYHLSIKTT
jgi:hypothetical protein